MTNVYGGDEVGAVVMDIGHCTSKVGYAGEDAPRSDITTIVGVHKAAAAAESGSTSLRETKYYIDTTQFMVPRSGQELKTFLRDGVIEDFDLFEKFLDYIYKDHVHSESQNHPVLFSEAPLNPKHIRERLTEIMFEKYNIPALFLIPNAVLCAFSAGRPTALVFDSGAHHSSAVPVLEGRVLRKGIVKTRSGGEYITALCYKQLMERNLDITPYYLVKSKEVVPPGAPASWTRRSDIPPGIHASWNSFMTRSEVNHYKHAVLRIADTDYDAEEVVADLKKLGRDPVVNYHFPDGLNLDLSVDDQYQLMEPFFNREFKPASESGSSAPATPAVLGHLSRFTAPTITYQEMILQSIAKCDIDIRPSLLSSILLAGGNTLIPGFTERITNELAVEAPQNLKMKVILNNTPVERKYAAWIGGSILASLGTFQQMWVSKLEYEEKGKSCINDIDYS